MNEMYVISEDISSCVVELNALAYIKLRAIGVCVSSPKIIFASLEGGKTLGYFDSTQNLIVLTKELADANMKEIRENIFLHELAHFVDNVRHGSSAHDVHFKEICKELGVDHDYDGAVAKNYFEKREAVQSKVEKLIALSSSDFEGEASSAISKAKELMERYNLKYLSEAPSNELYGIDVVSGARLDVWKRLLQSAVSSLTGVFRIEQVQYKNRILSFYGSAQQVESALYLWDYFESYVNCEAKKITDNIKGTGRRIRPAEIRNGIVMGIISKISDISEVGSSKAIALSVQKNEKLYCRINSTKVSHSKTSLHGGSQFYDGKSSGANVNIPSGTGSQVKRIGSV